MFAFMPPTFAADKKTYSGFSCAKNLATNSCFVRSSSLWLFVIRCVYPLSFKFLTIAEPTMPVCPATYIFEFLFTYLTACAINRMPYVYNLLFRHILYQLVSFLELAL